MGLLPTVLISLVFPALMLLITCGLGRMEEFLLPHLRTPWPADGDTEDRADDRAENSASEKSASEEPEELERPEGPGGPEEPGESRHAEEIRIANARADIAKARAEAVRRSARRRAYGTPRPVGRTNTGPPRGGRTTPLRFR